MAWKIKEAWSGASGQFTRPVNEHIQTGCTMNNDRLEIAQRFVTLLKVRPGERDIHAFLKDHRWIIDDYYMNGESGVSFSEYEIDRENRVDFCAVYGRSFPTIQLIELKGCNDEIRTAKGSLAAPLSAAISQCASRLALIQKNRMQAYHQMSKDLVSAQNGETRYSPAFYEPFYFEIPLAKMPTWYTTVFIGWDPSEDDPFDRESLNHLLGYMCIKTYASLASYLEKKYISPMKNSL
jgi:Domain of unknown function (DUF4263)